MSNYNSLKATIDANIKTNGNQEITGAVLNYVLNEVVTILGDGYQFKGIATTSTNPGTPDARVLYLAGAGTYTHFGQPTIQPGNLGVFWYDSSWHTAAIDVAPVIDIVNNLVTGGADKALSAEMGKYIGEILEGEPREVVSGWGSWALSSVSPYRAYRIASRRSVANGVVSVKLSSYSTYKIQVSIQETTGWTNDTISDTGWQTTDIRKVITGGEAGYYVRVGIGRVDNQSITLTEFLSVISELKYTYMEGHDGLVDRVQTLEDKMEDVPTMVDVIPDYIVKGEEAVNINSYPQVSGAIQVGGIWYVSTYGKHRAIPVTPGEKYVISGDGNGFWAWLSSSYSAPVTGGSSVPFASGQANRVLQKDAVAVAVPAGAAYLYINTQNGAGVDVAWKIWKVDSFKRRSQLMTRLRVAHWNIGLFVYTNWSPGDPTHTIPAADAAEYAQKYRELIDSIGADLMGVAEFDPSFSAAGWVTKDVIFQNFRSQHIAHKNGANCNCLFGDIMEWVGVEEVNFATTYANRYYTHLTARLNGENVHFVEAHLDHTRNDMRVAQIAQLVSDMSPYEHVIIVGDFNTGDEETVVDEYSAFTDAGYTMLNSDYLGLLVTSLTQEFVDNIIVKGFTMTARKVHQESGTLSDHLLLSCDLDMQFGQ